MNGLKLYEEDKQIAHEYGFDVGRWEHSDCLLSMKYALNNIFDGSDYICEKSTGKEKCLNINKRINGNKTRGRVAGIYIAPTKGCVALILSRSAMDLLKLYDIPNYTKEDNGQFHYCHITFPVLCTFCRLIVSCGEIV